MNNKKDLEKYSTIATWLYQSDGVFETKLEWREALLFVIRTELDIDLPKYITRREYENQD